jgi:predicted Rossmann-fold nucleotide-binding protein
MSERERPKQISVIGSGDCEEGSEAWGLAEEVGRRLAEAGFAVVCGGRGGVMEAVAAGAAGAGGTVIGVLPWTSTGDANPYCTHVVATGTGDANPYCTHVVATGIGYARNVAVVASGEATIAVGGGWGTLSEIGHARSMGRPVVALRSWALSGRGDMADAPGVIAASTPEEAVAAALSTLGVL